MKENLWKTYLFRQEIRAFRWSSASGLKLVEDFCTLVLSGTEGVQDDSRWVLESQRVRFGYHLPHCSARGCLLVSSISSILSFVVWENNCNSLLAGTVQRDAKGSVGHDSPTGSSYSMVARSLYERIFFSMASFQEFFPEAEVTLLILWLMSSTHLGGSW